jgi:TRAP-type C4-dicarboxylate transport system permease small subunit
MRKFLKNLDDNAERWLLLVFYTMIVVTIVIEVIRRFVLSYSSIWGEEIARYSFIYLVWIGASAAVKQRAHIRIDVLTHLLPNRGKSVLYLFGDLCTLALVILTLYWSFDSIIASLTFGSVTHGLRISLVWFFAALPVGLSLMLGRLVQSIWRDLNDLRAGRPVYEGERLFD